MTRLSPDQQALTLYQNLSGKAWIDAEKLDMDSLAAPGGVEYFLSWIKERYLDVQITQVGRNLSGFFRGLRRKPTQSVREYLSDFDRAHARLNEIGCCLPDLAAAWVFVDRMGLDEQAELNLLASVGNVYNLQQLQKAAIVHDRSLRKPWEASSRPDRSPPRREWFPRRNQTAHLTGHEDGEEDTFLEDVQDAVGDEIVPEEVAAEYYESYMTHETAKQRYKDTLKLRGSDPESLRKLSEDRLQAAKARSYCAGCRRRGHWNKAAGSGNTTTSGGNGPSSTSAAQRPIGQTTARGDGVKQHVVHVTWDIRDQASEDLLAITDTACSRSVAGIHWINSYVAMAKKVGFNVEFVHIQEAFRFGASRVFEARHAAVIYFDLGEKVIGLKVAVVYGEVPLLISRPVLGALGMIMDVANNRATFRALGVVDLPLQMTETGHPAFPVHPVDPRDFERKAGDWQAQEVEIFSRSQQYTVFALSPVRSEISSPQMRQVPEPLHLPRRIFYPKKIAEATKNLLLGDVLNRESFLAWWSQTSIKNDFWLEGEHLMVRVHVVPRRTFFNPSSWSTPKQELKDSLLQSLGHTRVVNAVSCQSRREFPAIHDMWKDVGADSSFPMLWIGRTVFCRASMPHRPLRDPVVNHGAETSFDGTYGGATQGDLGDAQGGTPSRSCGPQPCSEPAVDCGGAALRHPGGSSRHRRPLILSFDAPGVEQDDPPATQEQGEGDRARGPSEAQPRPSYEDDQRPRWHGRADSVDFREVQGDAIHRHTVGYRTWAVKEVANNDNASEDLRMFGGRTRARRTVWYIRFLMGTPRPTPPYPTSRRPRRWRHSGSGCHRRFHPERGQRLRVIRIPVLPQWQRGERRPRRAVSQAVRGWSKRSRRRSWTRCSTWRNAWRFFGTAMDYHHGVHRCPRNPFFDFRGPRGALRRVLPGQRRGEVCPLRW